MLSRLATVLQELSGEEAPDGDPQDGLVPQVLPGEEQDPVGTPVSEEAMERLAHLEPLVFQLKELIREKDGQLAQKDADLVSKDAQLKNERETAETRFTKLKLQAKAKMASLTKQISELKGQEGITSPDSSFTGSGGAAEEELKNKLLEEEANSRALQEHLNTTQQLLQEKETAHADQLRVLQTVVFEKDVRFQEQVQKHEDELLRVTMQSHSDTELQQALQTSQRRCEELEEAIRSRSQVLEMLQQELNSADQQKQILTAQFRQMEQELAEAARQREEDQQKWAQQATRTEAELETLRAKNEVLDKEKTEVAEQLKDMTNTREAEQAAFIARGEAFEKEMMEDVARLESELDSVKEAEFAAVQASRDATERDGMEIARLETELASVNEKLELAAAHAIQENMEREIVEIDTLQNEIASLREEQGKSQKRDETLAEVWRRLHALALEDIHESEEESPVPTDLSPFLGTLQSLEAQLMRLREERDKYEERCAQVTHSMEVVQEQLDGSTSECEEAVAKIQHLEQQIGTLSEPLGQDVIEPAVPETSDAAKAQILALEQRLLEKDNELAALKECLLLAKEQSSEGATEDICDQTPEQDPDAIRASCDSPLALPDLVEDTPEEETTLVAEDTSVLSVCADSESSPELIGRQSESPGESKGASSDEMVTSSDSEVAHSSWTLLEAVNQEGSQEWPSIIQDFGQLQLQSWEETSMEQETSTVQVASSSVVIRETVHVQLTQQGASTTDSNFPPGQVFAQALADELQKRYSELLAELQRLRETSAESQEKIHSLEEEKQLLVAVKEEMESMVQNFKEELSEARDEMHKLSQQFTSVEEKHVVEIHLLEEQLNILNAESETKEQRIKAMQTDLDAVQQALSEQEGHARMLSAQLEDRELLSSELERKLQDMENSLLEYSQTTDLNNTSLSEKDSEISELQLCVRQKDQEMMELNDGMSAKLLQAGEEKFMISSEVKKLKEQISELENVRSGQQEVKDEGLVDVYDELATLRKDKEELTTQLANLKKKCQAALVQRKELIKKVADFEEEAKKWKGQDGKAIVETPVNISEVEKLRAKEIQEMETVLEEVRQTLRSKEEAVRSLEQRIGEQEQILSETLVQNKKLSEEAQQTDNTEMTELQSHVASLEAECETLQKKLLEAQQARKETIRKAKEKDRHHREQLKQQKEEYNELLERFEKQDGEREFLVTKLRELEEQQAQRDVITEKEVLPHQETVALTETQEKPATGDWVQEDWVDFSESDSAHQQCDKPTGPPVEQPLGPSAEKDVCLQTLTEEDQAVQLTCKQLEVQLQQTQASLSLKETELINLGKELDSQKAKEQQIDVLLEEMDSLREKCRQAESYAETLKMEVEAAAGAMSAEASVVSLQAEMEEFKQFLDNKNREIIELSQQLSEQNTLLRSMQDTVSEKDQLIASLQEGLVAEQEKVQRLEAVVPQKQKGEKDNEAKIQQLQRKLQAALISRKEALKESKAQKEALASTEKLIAELQQNVDLKECELEKLRVERVRLIEEVDRTLLENQSLGSSCESLKLAMEGIITEKDTCKREAEFAKEEAARNCREYEDKVQGMKDEYETLLKSYENVSDEAERVRRVLEAARQERKELAARVRAHEVARQEAQQQAEEAQKEVDSIKDKMRKFAKTKQQKILELEEENERLREVEEKKTVRRDDRALKAELERLQEELGNLNADLDSIKAERDCLQQQVAELKEELAQDVEKRSQISPTSSSSEVVVEESVVAQQTCSVMAEISQDERESNSEEQPEAIEQAPSEEVVSLSAPETQLQSTEERSMETNKGNQIVLEGKIREMEAELGAERELRQEQEATLKAELGSLQKQLQECKETEQSLVNSLQQCLQESKDKEQSFMEEMSKREVHFKELRSSLEGEKDDLEERLMNQLAQLNGSIAGYQQESTDSRDRMAELQREVEGLETERAELEAESLSEKDRAARLEEDKRQAQRERDEAEAQSGKQRELEQQLKSAQRVKEGSQSRTRQLEELLREKQLEVRQMQRDCIKYQERISELGREAKALQLAHDELHRELEVSHAETSKTLEEMKRTESDLVGCKSQLGDAQKQASQALSEKTASEQAALQREVSIKAEAEQTLDSVRFRLGAELKQVELRLEDAYREREKEEEATLEARNMAASSEKQTREMQARLDESLARLAAFSRCMSSLQDDRDRVLDETRQWETRFNSTLQGKESEVREAETRVKELAEQLQKETTQREELQLSVDRLQKVDKDWVLRMEEEEKKLRETMAVLEEKKGKLEQAMVQIQSTQAEASTLESEVEGLRNRVRALEEAVGRLQGEADQARTELREREAEERRLCLTVEQLETDLRSSKALTESLQTELSEKERREVELLGEKEQAVTQAAEEARREADSRAQEAETELEQRREELRDLEAKLQKAKEDGNHSKARLDSFTKAMGSLQDDRDRVLNMYKQLEEKHLQVMMEKDALIQEAAGENNSLKEELRSLLVQRDDLYAEKAKLAAQLHGYREELNQVLSMKESQHRKLLAAQRERITSLESERDALETHVKNLSGDREVEAGAVLGRVERETLSQTSDSVRVQQTRDAPGAEVEKLREQLKAAREQAEALEYNVQHQREEQASKAKELAELRWEGGVMRTESESAQERVAELARDLMVIEQKLVEEKEVTAELRAENQSFGKAMASLQDSRDQAVNKAQELSLRLDEMSKAVALPALSSPGGSTGEVWGLKNALQALQNDRERLLEQLQQQTSELQRKKLELARLGAGELIKVSQELFEERTKAEETLSIIKQLEDMVEMGKQDIETLQLERIDWMAQAEQLKQQTLATLSERDQQLRQLTAMLEEAQAPKPKLLQEHYQRQGTEEVDSAPGAPQERSSSLDGHTYIAEVKELQRRLDEEMQQRMLIEEQLMASEDLLKRYTQGEWQAAHEGQHSETAVLIEPPEGVVTRSRRGGPGLMRMLRVAFCSRQRTPLLFSLYLLTVHVLLLLCLGGYL